MFVQISYIIVYLSQILDLSVKRKIVKSVEESACNEEFDTNLSENLREASCLCPVLFLKYFADIMIKESLTSETIATLAKIERWHFKYFVLRFFFLIVEQ